MACMVHRSFRAVKSRGGSEDSCRSACAWSQRKKTCIIPV